MVPRDPSWSPERVSRFPRRVRCESLWASSSSSMTQSTCWSAPMMYWNPAKVSSSPNRSTWDSYCMIDRVSASRTCGTPMQSRRMRGYRRVLAKDTSRTLYHAEKGTGSENQRPKFITRPWSAAATSWSMPRGSTALATRPQLSARSSVKAADGRCASADATQWKPCAWSHSCLIRGSPEARAAAEKSNAAQRRRWAGCGELVVAATATAAAVPPPPFAAASGAPTAVSSSSSRASDAPSPASEPSPTTLASAVPASSWSSSPMASITPRAASATRLRQREAPPARCTASQSLAPSRSMVPRCRTRRPPWAGSFNSCTDGWVAVVGKTGCAPRTTFSSLYRPTGRRDGKDQQASSPAGGTPRRGWKAASTSVLAPWTRDWVRTSSWVRSPESARRLV
mmetsp:Transcript_3241/g.9396  ORF Transcript_3241/g.9396 Transcript_3241/m.9396 type:complete len:397 (+) Transcript_3241:694-1884(+)